MNKDHKNFIKESIDFHEGSVRYEKEAVILDRIGATAMLGGAAVLSFLAIQSESGAEQGLAAIGSVFLAGVGVHFTREEVRDSQSLVEEQKVVSDYQQQLRQLK